MVKHEHGADAVPDAYVDHPGETNIQEIFDGKLADLYLRAIQRHCLNPAHACTYTLHSIDSAALSDAQVVLGPRRGQPMPKNLQKLRILNFIALVSISDEPTLAAFKEDIYKLFRESESDITVRIAVNVHCQETFAITETINGKLLQGSLLPKAVTHQIMLESSYGGQDFELLGDWQIIDIDNWLDGNEYWPKDLPGWFS